MQTVSDRGLMEIIGHEAIVLTPYYDSVGVLTIGVGHTKAAGGLDPASRWGKPLTVAEAIELFRTDIEKFSKGVRKAFKVSLEQHQFDAATSFHFNTGSVGDATWVTQFNAGYTDRAKASFMNWSKPPEIIPRREKERDLFFDAKYGNHGKAMLYPADAKGRVQWSKGTRVDLASHLSPLPTQPKPEKPAGGPSKSIWGILLDLFLKLVEAVGKRLGKK